jgi:uncharacterized protein YndB with AHSA1/START domain
MAIEWPDRYQPGRVAATVSNQILIAAPTARVWSLLVCATDWPAWYPNSAEVRIEGDGTELLPGARFAWRTFGVRVRSTVREFVPGERIAWDGRAPLLDIYHAWLIQRRPGGGSWVLTEENQNGLAARAQALLAPNRMFKGHQLWLDRLKAKAES